MAMFHFRLKSDKKPDDTRISAVQHVDYIRHEGNFAKNWYLTEKNKFVGNFISSDEIKDACKVLESLRCEPPTNKFEGFEESENSIQEVCNLPYSCRRVHFASTR